MNSQEKKVVVDLQLRVNSLERREKGREEIFKRLIDALVKGEILDNYSVWYYEFFQACDPIEQRLRLILKHLNLEIEWVECESHFELKEKEENDKK